MLEKVKIDIQTLQTWVFILRHTSLIKDQLIESIFAEMGAILILRIPDYIHRSGESRKPIPHRRIHKPWLKRGLHRFLEIQFIKSDLICGVTKCWLPSTSSINSLIVSGLFVSILSLMVSQRLGAKYYWCGIIGMEWQKSTENILGKIVKDTYCVTFLTFPKSNFLTKNLFKNIQFCSCSASQYYRDKLFGM